jgi:prepilin-type N-terminal cleavage/methylation domain-containing protein
MKKKGFTLIELIIVIVLLSVLVGVAAWTFVAGLRSWNSGIDRANIRQDGSFALEIMVRELSQADSFTIAQEDNVKFDADIDNDGSNETITYSTSDSELSRKVNGTTTVLSPDVDTFLLSYRDLNDTAMTPPITGAEHDDIRVITISLTMDRFDETLTLSSSAYARNQ